MRNEYVNMDISHIDYNELKIALKTEVYEKLLQNRPKTIYAASRIPGVTPSALMIIVHYKNKIMKNKLKVKK